MKTRNIMAVTALAFLAAACSKEPVAPTAEHADATSIPTHTPPQTDAKYSAEATIYDASHTHSVTYRIASNNKSAVTAMQHDLEASMLQLLDKVPDSKSGATSAVQGKEMPYDKENAIHLTEIGKDIGKSKGYAIEAVRQKDGYLESYSTITLTVMCSQLYISNQWIRANYNYHYYMNGSTYYFDRMEMLLPGLNYYFTAGGYTNHQVVSQPSYINGSFTVNNRIYWAAI